MNKLRKRQRPSLIKATMYDLHALLDYLVVECAVGGTAFHKRVRVPYTNILKPNPDYANSELVVEIRTYWDAATKESKNEPTDFKFSNSYKTRH